MTSLTTWKMPRWARDSHLSKPKNSISSNNKWPPKNSGSKGMGKTPIWKGRTNPLQSSQKDTQGTTKASSQDTENSRLNSSPSEPTTQKPSPSTPKPQLRGPGTHGCPQTNKQDNQAPTNPTKPSHQGEEPSKPKKVRFNSEPENPSQSQPGGYPCPTRYRDGHGAAHGQGPTSLGTDPSSRAGSGIGIEPADRGKRGPPPTGVQPTRIIGINTKVAGLDSWVTSTGPQSLTIQANTSWLTLRRGLMKPKNSC